MSVENLGLNNEDSKTSVVNGKSIYVIRADDGSVKVGISKNVDSRIKAIQYTSGKKVVNSYVTEICSNASEIELKVKEHFALQNILGEWFSCEFQEMVDFVKHTYDTDARIDFVNKNEHEKKNIGILSSTLGVEISKEQKEDIKEFVSTLLLLPKEDRAILLSNANALRVRRDIEKARGKE